MKIVTLVSLALFLFSLVAVLAVFFFYPLYLYLQSRYRRFSSAPETTVTVPSVSLIVVIHNASSQIVRKIRNSQALDYPQEHLDIFLCSDGSTDDAEELIRPYLSERVHFMAYPEHRGKAAVINDVVARCDGDLLLFSDVDAILAPDALKMLVTHFTDDEVGGVSGSRVIREDDGSPLAEPQQHYIFVDTVVKLLESRTGSTTSNDGKLYIIRRSLFRPVSSTATDDLYTCLNIVLQGKRFLFEPRAQAYIGKPSQGMSHEIDRRRRIVCRSLSGIWSMRPLLNPIRFKSFALGLFVNKVLRRALPVFLLIILVTSSLLAFEYPLLGMLVALQLLFYLLALFQFFAIRYRKGPLPIFERVSASVFYFCLGNIGTLLGLIDFIGGKRYQKWKPLKSNTRE